jgi:hypothetical protein
MTTDDASSHWHGPLVEAYAHVGDPRYGSLSNAERFLDRLGIRQSILVLGPGMPDLASLMHARRRHGSDVRLMGIPFGETEAQRRELVELQIRMGISGMRLMPFEIEPNLPVLERLGEEGLWLFAINPYDSMPATRFLLNWLERHPRGRVASPHFLVPETIAQRTAEPDLFKALLRHPRVHAILSRHGGVGSAEDYPHRDLRPWVEELAEFVTWDRLMWGSEFPILCQRNERPETVRDWMLNLGVELSEQEREAFYAGNARRLFFDDAAPAGEDVSVPAWVAEQTPRDAQVYLFPHNRMFLPMEDYGTLLTDYMKNACPKEPDLGFAEYMARHLSRCATALRAN